MKRILVIQTAFIGDVILATSLLETLKNEFPKAQLDFLVRRGNESLVDNHPFIHKVLIWDKKKAKYSSLWRLLLNIRSNRYDLVVNVQRFGATGILSALSNAQYRTGFKKNPFAGFFTHKAPHQIGDGTHEIERNFELIRPFISEGTQPSRPQLYPSKQHFNAVESYSQNEFICVAPTSVWFTKQWPAEKWVDFINQVEQKLTIYLLGGPGDRSACENIKNQSKAQVINLAGKLSFLESAALISKAKRSYVNDSGPLHISSAMNTPTTAVFCSTIPEFGFGPLSDHSKVVQIEKPLDCRPCGLHGKKSCPEGHFKCAYLVDEKTL